MLPFLEYLAVIVSAVFGVLLARSKEMDLIGACCTAFIVAFGGGTLRDVLLDRTPLFWVGDPAYAWTVFGVAVVLGVLPRLPSRLESWLVIPDALGLGLFSIVGATIAMQQQDSLFIAALFGVITGTFGGVIADIVCNEVPSLFRPEVPLYASCAFLGCWSYLGLSWLEVPDGVAMWTSIGLIVATRLAAVRFRWSLPAPPAVG